MMDLITAVMTAGLTTGGGFVGSWASWWVFCPNRRCCQMKKVLRVLEQPVTER